MNKGPYYGEKTRKHCQDTGTDWIYPEPTDSILVSKRLTLRIRHQRIIKGEWNMHGPVTEHIVAWQRAGVSSKLSQVKTTEATWLCVGQAGKPVGCPPKNDLYSFNVCVTCRRELGWGRNNQWPSRFNSWFISHSIHLLLNRVQLNSNSKLLMERSSSFHLQKDHNWAARGADLNLKPLFFRTDCPLFLSWSNNQTINCCVLHMELEQLRLRVWHCRYITSH